ncbi:MAG: hypothetical protein ACREL3_01460 [Gemmatimonadales bacterium]
MVRLVEEDVVRSGRSFLIHVRARDIDGFHAVMGSVDEVTKLRLTDR